VVEAAKGGAPGARQPFALVVRLVSLLAAVGFAVWAFADDRFIGGGPGFGSTQAALLLIGVVLAGCCLLPLSWNARALALLLSTLFMLFTTEAILQIYFSPVFKSENELDSRLLYRPVPGAVHIGNREAINGGDRITYQINSQGFRGAELETKPAFRVVVYGDSFIHGYYSDLPDTFAARLAHHLSKGLGRSIEVVNAGVAGYGPDQELRKMERELPELKPDLVLVAIFTGNDFGDLLRNKLYKVGPDGSLQENDFQIESSLERQMKLGREESILKRLIRDGVYALAVRLGLRTAPTNEVETMTPRDRMEYFRGRHVQEYEEYIVRGDGVLRDLAWDSYDADVSLTPKSDAALYKIQLMDLVIGQMQALCAGLAVPLVVIPIPHPVDVGGHATGEVDREKYPDYQPRGLVGIIEEITARRGIRSVDLYTPFESRGSEEIYFRGFDDHWSDRGQDIGAAVVSEALIAGGLLERPMSDDDVAVDGRP
jgi:hypothetical protein